MVGQAVSPASRRPVAQTFPSRDRVSEPRPCYRAATVLPSRDRKEAVRSPASPIPPRPHRAPAASSIMLRRHAPPATDHAISIPSNPLNTIAEHAQSPQSPPALMLLLCRANSLHSPQRVLPGATRVL
jgi:hypothetical protein